MDLPDSPTSPTGQLLDPPPVLPPNSPDSPADPPFPSSLDSLVRPLRDLQALLKDVQTGLQANQTVPLEALLQDAPASPETSRRPKANLPALPKPSLPDKALVPPQGNLVNLSSPNSLTNNLRVLPLDRLARP